jgi:hypothetical protein
MSTKEKNEEKIRENEICKKNVVSLCRQNC